MIDILLQALPFVCWGMACGSWYMVARLRLKENISLRKHIDVMEQLLDRRDELIVLQNIQIGLLQRLKELNAQGVQ